MLQVKRVLLAASSVVAVVAGSAWAQDVASPDAVETIVVTGIRGSLQQSAAIKRDSKQIVDVITAEDVGKLPDNNVPEALAHVTGVQIERSHGEGSSVSIRGMTNVSTTLNGNSASVGESRSMNLSDIPAELLKSVTVYKTRSADQVEGGIAGTVNVDLRRPLDLPVGLTVAGSVRAVNASIGNTWSPYVSALVADRFDTSLGEMGFLLNVSFTQNSYNENFFYNESPDTVGWSWVAHDDVNFAADQNLMWKSLSPTLQSLNKVKSSDANGYGPFAAYATYFGVEQGVNTRPSINLSTQWRYNDSLDFVLEGSYISSKNKIHRDRLHLTTRMDNYTLSNIKLEGDGNTIKSENIGFTIPVNGGPESYFETNNSDEFNTNFEAHWHSGRWQVNGSAQYNWSAFKYHGILSVFRFNNATTATVDFNSAALGGLPDIQFGNTDLSNTADYDLYQYHDERQVSHSQEVDGQLDATYRVSDDWYLRNIQVGGRYTDRHTTRNFGYRDAFFFYDNTPQSQWAKYMPVSNFACGNDLQKVQPDMKGAPSWYRLSSQCLVNKEAEIRQGIITRAAAGAADSQGRDWTTAEPPDVDLSQTYVSHELSLAGYVQANWAATVYFPIDGQIGTRIVNTWGDSLSTDLKTIRDSLTSPWYNVTSPHSAKKDYTDVLPNATATMHFTDKLQLRLSYTYQIDRPDFLSSSSWQVIDNPSKNIWAGNPDLKPMREHNYDASVEYFFGKAGQLSVGYFLKKPHGFIYYDGVLNTNASDPYYGYTTWTNRNAAPGTFEGLEFQAQSFFDFLPGFWSNFGASANATLMTSYKIGYTYLKDVTGLANVFAAAGTSRYTYNLALYYDTPEFSTRVSYNFRERWRESVYIARPGLSPWNEPTSRLDAAINYTPYKWMTLSLEGANLLRETNRSYWGKGGDGTLPESTRMTARTIQLSARFRY